MNKKKYFTSDLDLIFADFIILRWARGDFQSRSFDIKCEAFMAFSRSPLFELLTLAQVSLFRRVEATFAS